MSLRHVLIGLCILASNCTALFGKDTSFVQQERFFENFTFLTKLDEQHECSFLQMHAFIQFMVDFGSFK